MEATTLRKLGPLPKRNPYTIAAVQLQHAEGRPVTQIAAKLNVSLHTIYRWIHVYSGDLNRLMQAWDDHQDVASLAVPGLSVSVLQRLAAELLGLKVSRDQARSYVDPYLREANKARHRARYHQGR